MDVAVFWVAALLALGGALGVVLQRNPFYSVLSLVVHLVALAVLFLLLNAEFLAAAQVIVYAGAVMVLYVFVVAYVGGLEDALIEPSPAVRAVAPLFAVALLAELCVAIIGSSLKAIDSGGPSLEAGFGSPARIGELFLTKFLIPFEIVSFLLLVAAVGAVVLTRQEETADATSPPGERVAGPAGVRSGPGV
jgi:NADH:ubiquinone oxidoreductase subunit 6 (subunit J)